MAAQGATLGSSMWFDEDMVHALRNGSVRAGWSGVVDALGRVVITLEAAGQRHVWVTTGRSQPHPDTPGRNVVEARWPD